MRDNLRFSSEELDRTAALVKVLDSKTRLRILLLLDDAERVVRELVTELGKSQPLISQHLRVLRNAGLVSSSRHGREVRYALARAEVIDVIEELVELSLLDEARDDLAARRRRRNGGDSSDSSSDTAAGAAIISPPNEVRPEIDPGLTPRTPKPRRD